MMKATYLFWLLILFCFCFSLPRLHEASQEDMLRKLIKEKRSSFSSQYSDLASELETTKSIGKVNLITRDGSMEGDKISRLPGQPEGVDFNQYAGYVTVDSKNGRALFYYFVESPIDSSSKPLLLWLNGGPGCSSLAGAMMEIGPFRVNSDGKTLHRNMYAWNNVANVIFLESPAGVGFSYSNTTSDHDKSGDKRTADDSYTFLVNWMERFPQYKNRDFFITGESYAGHYGPQLAYTILMRNNATSGKAINLRGIVIGNAFVDDITNTKGTIDYLWSHALFSGETYSEIQRYCNLSNLSVSDKCDNAIKMAYNETGKISPYNIYAPLCHTSRGQDKAATYPGGFDPCLEYYMKFYLNIPEVQKALHANITKWKLCRDLKWNDSPTTMLPTIKQLIAAKLNIWLYSGDFDAVVPITDTRYFIKMLQLPVKNTWKAWYLNNEVGGYIEQYEGLTLATVRGAGHQVPTFQPERALAMITAFLQGKVLA